MHRVNMHRRIELTGWKGVVTSVLGLALLGLVAAGVVALLLVGALVAMGNAVLGAVARPLFARRSSNLPPHDANEAAKTDDASSRIIDVPYEIVHDPKTDRDN